MDLGIGQILAQAQGSAERLGKGSAEGRAVTVHGAGHRQLRSTRDVTAAVECPRHDVRIVDEVRGTADAHRAFLGVEEDEHPQAEDLWVTGDPAFLRS